jgi:hypothetical protein
MIGAVCLGFGKAKQFAMKPNHLRIVSARAEGPAASIPRAPTPRVVVQTVRRINAGRWIYVVIPALALTVAVLLLAAKLSPAPGFLPGIVAGIALLGAAIGAHAEKQIKAGIRHDPAKGNAVFTLSLDKEIVILEPGKTWSQVDHYKWIVRGLIEEPQMFHVFPDGSVEINSEKISITDLAAEEKLEHQINKRHTPTGTHKPQASTPSGIASAPTAPPTPDPRRFRVKLDHLGHVLIERGHGSDREETGLRGIATLIANGLIRKPDHYRVDPMQRSIEIDGVTFECNEAGVKRLEEALNTRYAPSSQANKAAAIEIKENVAASTRFDIHFHTTHAGVTRDIKGHLTQELLDVLQDPVKCTLILPGIHLLLSPPNLLIRRRRPDLGEEKIPELPDVNLLRLTSVQLQQIINHPLIRRNVGAAAQSTTTAANQPEDVIEMRVVRNPTDKKLLWLECATARGERHELKAFTHHNIADLQHGGCFLPHLEVCLSLDHRRLSIHDRRTHKEEAITLDTLSCSDEILREASRMLTRALKHSALRSAGGNEPVRVNLGSPGRAPKSAAPVKEPATIVRPAEEAPPTLSDALPSLSYSQPPPDPAIVALFRESDAVRINQEIFRRLSVHLGIAPQEVPLSLPCVFENRRFEVLNFERQEITSMMELRGTDFYGFYLSHVSEKKIVLVYACNGMHIEWGPDKCVLQPTIRSEAEEYKGSVLLGVAQDKKNEFVFVVQPEFKKWIAPREMPFTEENLQFLIVADIAAAPDDYKLIWPERPAARG